MPPNLAELAVPASRLRDLNAAPINPGGDCVLYWMSAFRRGGWNFALQRAVWWALRLSRPLVVLEALACDYPWASDRLHRFVLDGMADNAAWFAARPVCYHPYVEPAPRAGRGLLSALAANACLVVADDAPVFFLPKLLAAAARRLPVRLEAVDGNGLLPLGAGGRDYPSAYAFRRMLQRELPGHLLEAPHADPLAGLALPAFELPGELVHRWPAASPLLLAGDAAALARLPIDHGVPVVATRGGPAAAEKRLEGFLREGLPRYLERNRPDLEVASGLSPYLHFGHISSHRIFAAIAEAEGWSVGNLGPERRGQRSGWWGMTEAAEAFLDQFVTWRELGFNFCAYRDDAETFEGLPEWAQQTLARHAGDPRRPCYAFEEFAAAATDDPLWNAAQRQLLREGRLHNYLRMLWGKKILEWSASPREALSTMFELNNRYALDGRDPNSASGIAWCLGRFDRPWGPERPVFGKVRYMSSQNTARKYDVRGYLALYGGEAPQIS